MDKDLEPSEVPKLAIAYAIDNILWADCMQDL